MITWACFWKFKSMKDICGEILIQESRSNFVISLFIFRRAWKIAKSGYYLRHVHLSVRMEQLRSHYKDFYETWY